LKPSLNSHAQVLVCSGLTGIKKWLH